MLEIRCGHCRKLLCRGEYLRLEIKCPRCGALNQLRTGSPEPERRGAPSEKESDDRIPYRALDGRQAPPG